MITKKLTYQAISFCVCIIGEDGNPTLTPPETHKHFGRKLDKAKAQKKLEQMTKSGSTVIVTDIKEVTETYCMDEFVFVSNAVKVNDIDEKVVDVNNMYPAQQ